MTAGILPIWSHPTLSMPRLWAAGFSWSEISLCIAYILSCCAVGEGCVIGPIFLEGQARFRLFTLLAGFLPGYIILIPLNRLLSLCFSNATAAKLELLAALLGALATLKGRVEAKRLAFSKTTGVATPLSEAVVDPGVRRGRISRFSVPPCFWILGVLILWSATTITGDATSFTFKEIFSVTSRFPAPESKLPMFAQHYDELVFLHPVFYSGLFGQDSDLLWPYLFLNAFAKCSGLFIVYLSLRRLKLSKHEAGALSFFLFTSSLQINPTGDAVLFDSNNPILRLLHTARVLGCIAPLVVSVLFLRYNHARRSSLSTHASSLALVTGLGCSSMSIHIAFTAGLTMALLWLFTPALKNWQNNPQSRSISGVMAIAVLLIPILIYERHFGVGSQHVAFLLVIIVIFSAFLFEETWRCKFKNIFITRSAFTGILPPFLWGSGLLLGLVFLGNLLSEKAGSPSMFGVELLKRTMPEFTMEFVPGLLSYDYILNSPLNLYFCAKDFPSFIAHLGLPLLLCAGLLFAYQHLGITNRKVRELMPVVRSMLIGFLVGLFLYHFMANCRNPGVVWFRSRFLEGWMYSLIAVSFCGLFFLGSRIFRKGLFFGLLVWATCPLLFDSKAAVLMQLSHNLLWFLSR